MTVINVADLQAMLGAVSMLLGCQWYAATTPQRLLEDPTENYERVFGHPTPGDTEIVHSVVIDYAWRPGVVTTDDWAFEVLAPRSWIEEQIRDLRLVNGRGDGLQKSRYIAYTH